VGNTGLMGGIAEYSPLIRETSVQFQVEGVVWSNKICNTLLLFITLNGAYIYCLKGNKLNVYIRTIWYWNLTLP